MNSIFALSAAILMIAAAAQAQERSAGQAMDAQVNWSALKNSINLVSTQNKALAATITKMQTCNAKKKIYTPADAAADANGCVTVGTLADLKTQVISGSVCEDARTHRNSGSADTYKQASRFDVYTKTVSCPQGWTLLGCSGGPGDTLESGEGSFVRPVGNDSCELVIGQPVCSQNLYWTKSWVFAHCAKVD